MKLIKNYESKTEEFNSSMLQLGEMMEVTGTECAGHIILRAYGEKLISLTDPRYMWTYGRISLKGRKLTPGESVTLIQE